MTSVKLLPHREANASSVEWGPWWVSIGGGPRSQADAIVESWDYATSLNLQLQPAIHEDAFLGSTGLPTLALCDVVALVECPSTGYRLTAAHNLYSLMSTEDMVLELRPDPQRIAQSIKLSAHVVLAKDFDMATHDAAARKGSRLASARPTTLSIEGSGARFPTEAISFNAMGYDDGLWSLQHDLSDGEDLFGSAVRLFINSDHPAAGHLLDGGGAEQTLIQSALETDTVRQLIAGAASQQHGTFVEGAEWTEGSVGHALESVSELFFSRSLHEMIRLYDQDRIAFERLLQSRTRMFKG